MKKDTIKERYTDMIDWNLYRLDQNKESLGRLIELLPKLEAGEGGDAVYQADILDLQSLRLIYETSIRNFEGKVEKYKELLKE